MNPVFLGVLAFMHINQASRHVLIAAAASLKAVLTLPTSCQQVSEVNGVILPAMNWSCPQPRCQDQPSRVSKAAQVWRRCGQTRIHQVRQEVPPATRRRRMRQCWQSNRACHVSSPPSRHWRSITGSVLRLSLGLVRTAYLPVMTTARITSLVMDSYQ